MSRYAAMKQFDFITFYVSVRFWSWLITSYERFLKISKIFQVLEFSKSLEPTHLSSQAGPLGIRGFSSE